MNTGMNTCAHPRCTTVIADHEVACNPHWTVLSERLRSRIWANYRRNPGGKAHLAAIAAARAAWWRRLAQAEPRCAECRTKNVLGWTADGIPLCLTCAKAGLDAGGPDLFRCPRCHRDVIGLVSVDDGPEACCACQEKAAA